MSECTHDCSSCGATCSSRKDPQSFLEAPHRLSKIKKVIGVVSGKGGVGKSLVTSLLACAAAKDGKETGFRKAFTLQHIDDWCVWSFKSSLFASTPLDDIYLTWKGVKKQGHVRLAPGKAVRKVIIPEINKQK